MRDEVRVEAKRRTAGSQVLTQNEILRFLHQTKDERYCKLFLLELGTEIRRGENISTQMERPQFYNR